MIATAIESSDCDVDNFDWEVSEAVKAALGSSKYSALRKLTCRVFGGVVEISGIVPSYYLKQLAQAAVLQLGSANSVRNLVEVSGEPAALVAKDCGLTMPPTN